MTGIRGEPFGPDLSRLGGQQLSKLLQMAVPHGCHREADEHSQWLSDFMNESIGEALTSADCSATQTSLTGNSHHMTVSQAILEGQASAQACRAVKEFAQNHRRSPSVIPAEVSTVLYYAAIAGALYHHNRLITRLDTPHIAEGLAWCANQAWVDGALQALCLRARRMLSGPTHETPFGADHSDQP
jgi:hypothetical protein